VRSASFVRFGELVPRIEPAIGKGVGTRVDAGRVSRFRLRHG
jgi:hypothetical protein